VRQQLLRVPDVAKVELFGVQDEKLFIEISQKRLAQLGLDMNQVLAQLGQQNAVEGAALVQTPLDQVQVRVGGQFNAIEDLRAMPIRGSSGAQLRLATLPTSSAAMWTRHGEGAPPGQGGDCAGRVHGQGRRHHRAGQGAGRPPGRIKASCRWA
jgi:Cu/Ag efflux pump CusA